MAALYRLAGRQICSKLVNHERNSLLFIRSVTVNATPYKPPAKIGYDEDNMKLGRPLSPHLSIYQPQLTTILSITHRATGIALTTAVIGLGYFAYLPVDFNAFATFWCGLPLICTLPVKAGIAWSISFHYVNGIRHLLWDMGKFLSIKQVYSTGYGVVAVSTVLALGLVAL